MQIGKNLLTNVLEVWNLLCIMCLHFRKTRRCRSLIFSPVYRGITMVLLVKLLLPPAFKYPEKKASPNRINNQSNQKSLAESNSKWVILTSKSTYSCFAFKKICSKSTIETREKVVKYVRS